jgi:trk system potassium uptake protein TrkH
VRRLITPFTLPIIFFGAAILTGTLLLQLDASASKASLGWVDALFTATSATCVTGLVVQDTGTFFTLFGQSVILGLIQLGGLGFMTFSSLILYLWRQRISLTDRLAVGQGLLHDPSFDLGRFLIRIVMWTFVFEGVGAGALFLLDPDGFDSYSAVFHAVSAFCNAGFSLYSSSLVAWRGDIGVNLVFMVLIVLGGIGFSVLVEVQEYSMQRLKGARFRLSFYAGVVLRTSAFLVALGALAIFGAEFIGWHQNLPWKEKVLSALFQSVTCRTAGFNTLNVANMTNLSLLFMLLLMFVGGSPGSCAGGIKTTTFRTLTAFALSRILGREQTVVADRALDENTLDKALTLSLFALSILALAMVVLTISEGGDIPHPQTRGQFLEILFETVSAFGTVGLSTGITPTLSVVGKLTLTVLMFLGRLGPILFLSAIQGFRDRPHYSWPKQSLLIG